MAGNFYPGEGSVLYVQTNGNVSGRSEHIMSERIRNTSRLCTRISCYADSVDSSVSQATVSVRNAAKNEIKSHIVKDNRDIGKNTMFFVVQTDVFVFEKRRF